jgi:oligopeptide transporter, OPT family
VIGVLFGSVVIAPVLGLLQSTFGFAGTPGAKDNALNAPQASIISKLAKGIFDNSLDWTYIGWGAFIGIVVIVVDETLKRGTAGRLKLPPLAVGMGPPGGAAPCFTRLSAGLLASGLTART